MSTTYNAEKGVFVHDHSVLLGRTPGNHKCTGFPEYNAFLDNPNFNESSFKWKDRHANHYRKNGEWVKMPKDIWQNGKPALLWANGKTTILENVLTLSIERPEITIEQIVYRGIKNFNGESKPYKMEFVKETSN